MASSAPSVDTIITIKVAYDGLTRRAKMPLRDTAPRILEEQIRAFLHIPADADIILERYSDSASAYVVLHPDNTAVYKQLYRAAKAKSKLKLRVTLKQQEDAVVPKPVTIEDVQDDNTASYTNSSATYKPQPAQTPVPPPAPRNLASPSISKLYESSFLTAGAKIASNSDLRREFHARVAGLGAKQEIQREATLSQPQEQQQPQSSAGEPLDFASQCCRFAICCNSCQNTTPDVHYHCSTCDDGDFDLCQSCVDKGITCYSGDHWLIKRTKLNGQIVNSVTETIAPKIKVKAEPEIELKMEQSLPSPPTFDPAAALASLQESLAKLELANAPRVGRVAIRTCNSCIQELPDSEFLHCNDCEDYDLCQSCFSKEAHSHHPKHAFSPCVPGTILADHISAKLAAGRNQVHHAICDGCDKFITGIRHKCLDCPDWDYCVDCIPNSSSTHPSHRFVPIYEPLKANYNTDCPAAQPIHVGVCCDGPLCSAGSAYPSYIRGVRYKCAVCHDVDFCASCEAYPISRHNPTHPLIKIKLPIRHVSVTTQGEHPDGQQMPPMGDRYAPLPQPPSSLSMNAPQTVVDTKPEPAAEPEVKAEKQEPIKIDNGNALRAMFIRDEIRDGTIMAPNQTFEQTWVLKNEGQTAWPAGCSIKFVGGDYMGNVDSSRPARTAELIEASETNACSAPVAPGQDFAFTVKLRTPHRAGKVVSYWRPTTPDGAKFGDRLWCEVNVRMITPESSSPVVKAAAVEEKKEAEVEEETELKSSQMIFPKLEKESPEASVHQEKKETEVLPVTDDFEDCGNPDDWDDSSDGFLTDEEYDILDASDEELLEEQNKKASK